MSDTKQMIDSFGRTQEDNAKRLEVMELANKEARENWDDPQWRAEFAADLTESILKGFDYETLVDQWIDTERTDFDGRIFIREAIGPQTQEEITRKGMIGVYHGANIITLKNFKDENNDPYIPNNELWVMAKDTGKFAFFGGLKSKEFMELDNWYWHYLARRDTGILVHHPERAQLLIDSSI
jgi:hypothetical protein